MGGIVRKITRKVKKVVKKVTKVVKKVVKGVGKVAKKVWKGVKGAVKKIGKAVKKMGPLASIAIGFIPGFQGLWANAGIWGAMGKGAITGFITSGGKLKGALIGAAGGGLGYAANAGIDAYQKGYSSLGESASISDKIIAGFGSVGNSTVDGVSNMYNSARDVITTGDFSKVNYLTDSGVSVYTPEGIKEQGFSDIPEDTFVRTEKGLRRPGGEMDRAVGDLGEVVQKNAKVDYINRSGDWTKMSPSDQLRMQQASINGKFKAMDMAESLGYKRDAGLSYFKNAQATPDMMREVGDYMAQTNTGYEQGSLLWEQTGGQDLAQSFDYDINLNTGKYGYTGDGLELTRQAAFGGTPTYISDPARAKEVAEKNKKHNVADSLKSLLGSKGGAGTSLPFSTGDTGDQYNAGGGLLAMSGETGTALDFAQDYGGALGGSAYADKAAQEAKRRYNINVDIG